MIEPKALIDRLLKFFNFYIGLLLLTSGCAPYQTSEVWMGPAFLVTPTASMSEVTFDAMGQASARSVSDVEIAAGGPFQVTLTSYQLLYLDQAGRPIDALATSESALEPAIAVGGVTPKGSVYLPVVSPAVVSYGADTEDKNTILCRVTLKGTGADGKPLELVTGVPIRFNHPTPG